MKKKEVTNSNDNNIIDKKAFAEIKKLNATAEKRNSVLFKKYIAERDKQAKRYKKEIDALVSPAVRRVIGLELKNFGDKTKSISTDHQLSKRKNTIKKERTKWLKKFMVDTKAVEALEKKNTSAAIDLYIKTMFKEKSGLVKKVKNTDYLPKDRFLAAGAPFERYAHLTGIEREQSASLHSDQSMVHNDVSVNSLSGDVVLRSQIQLLGTSDHDLGITRAGFGFFMRFNPEHTRELLVNFRVHRINSSLTTLSVNEFGYSAVNSVNYFIIPKCRIFGLRNSDWIPLRGERLTKTGSTLLDHISDHSFGNRTWVNNQHSHAFPTLRSEQGPFFIEFGFDFIHEVFVNDVSICSTAFEHFNVSKIGLTLERA